MPLTGEQIRVRGLAALKKELGRAGLARFLRHYEPGSGDYTSERAQLLDGLTMAQLRRRASKTKGPRTKSKSAR
ncbi:MAG: hypothetical protein HC834_04715 [Rhodospirillales bacterium]|nr:hypothetical protein [Rhodospirillales bacterium]